MHLPSIIMAVLMSSIGLLVKAYPNLIAGYNSMPKHKRAHVNYKAKLKTEILFNTIKLYLTK